MLSFGNTDSAVIPSDRRESRNLQLSLRVERGRMLRMAAARIAAIVLALTSCTALSQQAAKTSLIVTVKDQAGALIPGAQVTVTNPKSGAQLQTIADKNGPSTGQAALTLDPGRYDLRVRASGFKFWEEKDLEMRADTRRTVVLPVSNNPCGVCIDPLSVIPEEHPRLTTDVPLMPIQQFAPNAKRLRSRLRLF